MQFLCHINFVLFGAEIGFFDYRTVYNNPLSIGEFFYLTAEGAEEERGKIRNSRFILDFFAYHYYPRLSFAG